MRKAIIIALFGISLFGEGKEVKPPTIPVEHSAEFYSAYVTFLVKKAEFERAQSATQEAQTTLAKDCGEKYAWDVSKPGKPVCVAKPEAKK